VSRVPTLLGSCQLEFLSWYLSAEGTADCGINWPPPAKTGIDRTILTCAPSSCRCDWDSQCLRGEAVPRPIDRSQGPTFPGSSVFAGSRRGGTFTAPARPAYTPEVVVLLSPPL
jgi:hypothetical protein